MKSLFISLFLILGFSAHASYNPPLILPKIAGYAYFAATTSCTWSRTSTTLGALTSTAACPGPTVSYSSLGSWQTTDADLPKITINSLPAGLYKAIFKINSGIGTSQQLSAGAINDGSTTCTSSPVNGGTGNTGSDIECFFLYTSSGNRTFELYVASAANAFNINNNITAPPVHTRFILEYWGPQ